MEQLKRKEQTADECLFWERMNKQLEDLPKPEEQLLPGICWGNYYMLYTPAYWKMQYLLHNPDDKFDMNYKMGENICEEVIACLLGGFGLKSEMGQAAFYRLKTRNYIRKKIEFATINDTLREPFTFGDKKIRYRFPNQKAKFISEFLNRDDLDNIPSKDDLAFREWLLSIKGIGPKTASWITRNHLNSENVAIIDVHIYRAGLILGIFSKQLDIQRNYFQLEKIFLQFCNALSVLPSRMDSIIWSQMKASNRTAVKVVNQS